MRTYLIATTPQDLHATIVEAALREMGERCVRWITGGRPDCDESIHFDDASDAWILDVQGGSVTGDLVFWNRRVAQDLGEDPELAAPDQIVATRERRAFLDNALALLNTAETRINDVYAASRAENKALQLAIARRCRLATPETLITNSPARIRAFVQANAAGGVIAKPFSPTVWEGSDGEFVGRAARLTEDLLPSDPLLRACPMIFQRYVPKRFEVRVTCFGTTLVAAKLDSQSHESSRVDWRGISPRLLNVEPIEMPDAVRRRCVALLRALGLEFGCIDLVVRPDGEWVFLEINQMGQFLWLEEVNPELRLLDLFLQLLTGTIGSGSGERFGLDFAAIRSRALQTLEQERAGESGAVQGNRVRE